MVGHGHRNKEARLPAAVVPAHVSNEETEVQISASARRLLVPLGVFVGLVVSATVAGPSAADSTTSLERVIVVMRAQDARQPAIPGVIAERRTVFAHARVSVLDSLGRHGVRAIHVYTIIDALSATVSRSEAAQLRADPAVRAVIPDAIIRLTPEPAPAGPTATGPSASPLPGACTASASPQLEPEALGTVRADSDSPSALTARSLGITGAGVKVAYIASGIDTGNPDFKRANGQSVFFDHKDFSGAGTAAAAGGPGEAFIDASAIAAQGRLTYDANGYSALPLNQTCKIRIEGVAPGVQLAALEDGPGDTVFASSIVAAIDHAVATDRVAVLNESVGSNTWPDDQGPLDLIKQANAAAVAAGTTVVVAAGDAGPTNTIESPATDPNVISVGATTTYRLDAQTGEAGARLPGVTGWLDNNIAPLSSGGVDQGAHTVDLVAPGDSNWALCTANIEQYPSCKSDAGKPSSILAQGGTSQAAPIVAGVAALVIQAYRQTHGGQSPTPALVKQLITSNAADIHAPADQQGSGRVDAYNAVLAAEQYQAAPAGPEAALLLDSPTQLNAIAAEATPTAFTEKMTNAGSGPEHLTLSTRTLGAYTTLDTQSVSLQNTDPQFVTANGLTNNLQTIHFSVPASESRLDASIAYADTAAVPHPARITLVDPAGRLASYSDPQGLGSRFGDAQVTSPAPGTWTAYVYSPDSADQGFIGKVIFGARVAKYAAFGRVSPSTLTLGAGQSGTVTVSETTPSTPGDIAGSVVVAAKPSSSGASATTTIPVTLRSLIPTGASSFTGTLTGGNGRAPGIGQNAFYDLDVATGAPQLNATITLGGSADNPFSAYLVDPEGQAEAYAVNTVYDDHGNPINQKGAQLHVVSPEPGRWRLLIVFRPWVSGAALSESFTVTTNQTAIPVSSGGLPDSGATRLTAGTSAHYTLKILNGGPGDAFYFVDARLPGSVKLQLGAFGGDNTVTEPFTSGLGPSYEIPTHTSTVTFTASTGGAYPIQFDAAGPGFGDPDIISSSGKTATASLSASRVETGPWFITPTYSGVFGSAAQPSETVRTSAAVTTTAIDPAVTSPTGDLEAASVDPVDDLNNFSPIFTAPGTTATIPVTITPKAAPGTLVTGILYVDDFSSSLNVFISNPIGQEIVAVPYAYTVASAQTHSARHTTPPTLSRTTPTSVRPSAKTTPQPRGRLQPNHGNTSKPGA